MRLAARHIEALVEPGFARQRAFDSDRRSVGGWPCAYVRRLDLAALAGGLDDGACCILLQLSGQASWTEDGASSCLAPGQALLVAGQAPARFETDARGACLWLRVPAVKLGLAGRSVRAARLQGAPASLFGAFLRSAFDNAGALTADQDEAVADILLKLILTCWPSLTSEPAADLGEPALVSQVKAYMLQRLDDPDLCPSDVARAHKVSVRHLHRLFRGTGVSLGDWLRETRLARCAADLRSTAHRHQNLTQIAFRWGFSDSAHFSRAFRAQYGQPPRAYRAMLHGA